MILFSDSDWNSLFPGYLYFVSPLLVVFDGADPKLMFLKINKSFGQRGLNVRFYL